jgi:6-phosphogluconolactonase
MAQSITPVVRVYPDADSARRAGAKAFVDVSNEVLAKNDTFSVAVAGGTTPRLLYQILSYDYIGQVLWPRVHIYWGDERYVPQRHRDSNFRMFHEALLDRVHIPLQNIHPMQTYREDAENAALDYERFLRVQFEGQWPRLDAVMLGMGWDGHIASLFPHSPALDETERWVVVTEGPVEPRCRLTLTLPAINAAANILFLVTGEEKASALSRALAPPQDKHHCPASAVRPVEGRLTWCVDEAAASLVDESANAQFDIERFGPEE